MTAQHPHIYYDPAEEKVELYRAEGLAELGAAMAAAEAGDDPGPKRMALAIRHLWGMIYRAEETSVYWMHRADEAERKLTR